MSTLEYQQLETIRTLVDAMPEAAMVVDSECQIVHHNSESDSLLGDIIVGENMSKVFVKPHKFVDLFKRAARSSGKVPALLRGRNKPDNIRVDVRSLIGETESASRLYLLTVVTREIDNSEMLALKHRLDKADRKNQELVSENLSLAYTVNQTLPKLQALSYEDSLTGVRNRRFFDRQYRREWHRALRHSSNLTLVCIDIDYFKLFNDGAGHPAGDRCLSEVASALELAVTREFDFVCRTGGEEFVLLLPMTDADGGLKVATQAVDAVRSLQIKHPQGGLVTVSAGVGTCSPEHHHDHLSFLAKVDGALYQAKEQGRDRVVSLRRSLNTCTEPDRDTYNSTSPLSS